ncbi:hypothetical protein Scep_012472 [Stephania cephalantha]|uniref:Protein kinase domain-containing protein n=1 Tax=Stephania cephalantha TaxID=152367 RepID=A0AAP0JF72_9MAGN
MSSGLAQEISLRSFQYEELEQATNGFKEEVGRGAFGTVFKGTLPNNNQAIAVKKINRTSSTRAVREKELGNVGPRAVRQGENVLDEQRACADVAQADKLDLLLVTLCVEDVTHGGMGLAENNE